MAKKRAQGRNKYKKDSAFGSRDPSHEIYESMIKCTLLETREITDREESIHQVQPGNGAKQQRSTKKEVRHENIEAKKKRKSQKEKIDGSDEKSVLKKAKKNNRKHVIEDETQSKTSSNDLEEQEIQQKR